MCRFDQPSCSYNLKSSRRDTCQNEKRLNAYKIVTIKNNTENVNANTFQKFNISPAAPNVVHASSTSPTSSTSKVKICGEAPATIVVSRPNSFIQPVISSIFSFAASSYVSIPATLTRIASIDGSLPFKIST